MSSQGLGRAGTVFNCTSNESGERMTDHTSGCAQSIICLKFDFSSTLVMAKYSEHMFTEPHSYIHIHILGDKSRA